MAADIDIALEDGPTKGRYVARVAGKPDSEMTFSHAGADIIIIDHTEVPESLAGMGVGKAMVLRAVEDARKSGVKILPLCPFARAQFQKHPEWADVLRVPV